MIYKTRRFSWFGEGDDQKKEEKDNLTQKAGKAAMVAGLGTAAVGGGMYASGYGKVKSAGNDLFGKDVMNKTSLTNDVKNSFKAGSDRLISNGKTYQQLGEKAGGAKGAAMIKGGTGLKRMGTGMKVGKVGGMIALGGLATTLMGGLFKKKNND